MELFFVVGLTALLGWPTTFSVEVRKKMLSVEGDVAALTEVMRVWPTRHKRWGSQVYLAGESCGT